MELEMHQGTNTLEEWMLDAPKDFILKTKFEEALQEGKLDEARKLLYTLSESTDPEQINSFLQCVKSIENGDYLDALFILNAAPTHGDNFISGSLYNVVAEGLEEAGDNLAASFIYEQHTWLEDEYTRLLEEDLNGMEQSPEALFLERSMRHFAEEVNNEKVEAKTHFHYAYLLANVYSFEESLEQLLLTLKKQPDHADAWQRLLLMCQITAMQQEEGEGSDADEEELERILEALVEAANQLSRKDPHHMIWIARLSMFSGNPDAIQQALNQAKSLAPKDPEVIQNYIGWLLSQEKFKELSKYIEKHADHIPERKDRLNVYTLLLALYEDQLKSLPKAKRIEVKIKREAEEAEKDTQWFYGANEAHPDDTTIARGLMENLHKESRLLDLMEFCFEQLQETESLHSVAVICTKIMAYDEELKESEEFQGAAPKELFDWNLLLNHLEDRVEEEESVELKAGYCGLMINIYAHFNRAVSSEGDRENYPWDDLLEYFKDEYKETKNWEYSNAIVELMVLLHVLHLGKKQEEARDLVFEMLPKRRRERRKHAKEDSSGAPQDEETLDTLKTSSSPQEGGNGLFVFLVIAVVIAVLFVMSRSGG